MNMKWNLLMVFALMTRNVSRIQIYFIILFFFCAESSQSQTQTALGEEFKTSTEIDSSFIRMNDFPQVDIIGKKPSLINRIPGSANIITETPLRQDKPITGKRCSAK